MMWEIHEFPKILCKLSWLLYAVESVTLKKCTVSGREKVLLFVKTNEI